MRLISVHSLRIAALVNSLQTTAIMKLIARASIQRLWIMVLLTGLSMVTACSPVTEKAKMLLLMVTAPDFVFIRGGEFTMGSPETEVGTSSDETQHQVKLSDFYMSKYELTVA
jgi:formylglycine-generating enzyme required for sulfatase activity